MKTKNLFCKGIIAFAMFFVMALGFGLTSKSNMVHATEYHVAGEDLTIQTGTGIYTSSTTFANGKYLHLDTVNQQHYTNSVSLGADMEYDVSTGVLKIFNTDYVSSYSHSISVIASNETEAKLTIVIYRSLTLYTLGFSNGDLTITSGEDVHNVGFGWENKIAITGKLTISGEVDCHIMPNSMVGMGANLTTMVAAEELELLDQAKFSITTSFENINCLLDVKYLTLNTEGKLHLNGLRSSATLVMRVEYQVNLIKVSSIIIYSHNNTETSVTNSTYLRNAASSAPIAGFTATMTNYENGDYNDYGNKEYGKRYELKEQAMMFNVSYKANGGSGNMDTVKAIGDYTIPASTFTAPDNKVFVGWAENSYTNHMYYPGDTYVVGEDVAFYAVWENRQFTNQPLSQARDTAADNKEITSTWSVNFPAVKYAYVKNGSDVQDLNTTDHFSEEHNTVTTNTYVIRAYYDATHYIESEEFTLSWTTTVIQVIYSPGEGSGSNDTYEFETNDTIELLECGYFNFSRDGYTFSHWSIRNMSNNTVEVAQKNPGETYTLTEDIVVAAIWEEKEIDRLVAVYTGNNIVAGNSIDSSNVLIKLYYNDGSFDVKDKYQVGFKLGTTNIDDIDTFVLTTPGINQINVVCEEEEATMNVKVVGFDVTLNSNNEEGVETVDSNKYGTYTLPENMFAPEAGKQFAGWAYTPIGNVINTATIEITEDKVLYAIWENIPSAPQSISATYTGTIYYGETINPDLLTVTLTYDDQSTDDLDLLTEVSYYDGNELITNPAAYIFNQAGINTITIKYALNENISCILQLNVNNGYTLTFRANGGTGIMNPVDHLHGSYTLPASTFTAPEGMRFKTWLVSGVEEAVGNTIQVNANNFVDAVWEDKVVEQDMTTSQASAGVDVKTTFDTAKANGDKVILNIDNASVKFDTAAVNAIGGNANITFTMSVSSNVSDAGVEGAQRVIEISINGFTAGKATVEIPFTTSSIPAYKFAKVYYVDGSGNKEEVTSSFENDKAIFEATHFSKYVIAFVDAPAQTSTVEGGLTAGAIVAIVLVSVIVLTVGIFALVWFVIKKKTFADFKKLFAKKK